MKTTIPNNVRKTQEIEMNEERYPDWNPDHNFDNTQKQVAKWGLGGIAFILIGAIVLSFLEEVFKL